MVFSINTNYFLDFFNKRLTPHLIFLNMALSKRKKQQLNWGIGGTSDLTRNEAQDAVVAV